MEISIIMSVYNAQAYLDQALKSIAGQTMADYELILVDDNSTDATPLIISRYMAADPRLRCFLSGAPGERNKGPSVARNIGLAEATGKYIYFADADDELEPDMLQILYDVAESRSAQIVCCGYAMITEGYRRPFLYKGFHAADPKALSVHIPSLQAGQLLNVLWNKLFRRDFIESAGIRFPEYMRSGQDRHFNIRSLHAAASFSFVDRPLYNYHVRLDGITLGYFDPKRFDWASEIFLMQKDLYRHFGILTPDNLAALSFLYIKVVLACFAQLFFRTCSWTMDQKKAYVTAICRDGNVADALSASNPRKPAHKAIVIGLRTGSPRICLFIAWMTAFSGRYLQQIMLRIKY